LKSPTISYLSMMVRSVSVAMMASCVYRGVVAT
jgi:hypothetical protein